MEVFNNLREKIDKLSGVPLYGTEYISKTRLHGLIDEVEKDHHDAWNLYKDIHPTCNEYSEVYWVTVRQKHLGVVDTRKMRWCGKWVWLNGQDVLNEWEVIAWQPYVVPEPYKGKGGVV